MTYADLQESFLIFSLCDRCTLREIKTRHRELVKRHHPDTGNDDDKEKLAFIVEKQLKQQGVTVITGCAVTGFNGNICVETVCIGGQELPADLVVLAPGVTPNVGLTHL